MLGGQPIVQVLSPARAGNCDSRRGTSRCHHPPSAGVGGGGGAVRGRFTCIHAHTSQTCRTWHNNNNDNDERTNSKLPTPFHLFAGLPEWEVREGDPGHVAGCCNLAAERASCRLHLAGLGAHFPPPPARCTRLSGGVDLELFEEWRISNLSGWDLHIFFFFVSHFLVMSLL